MPTEKEIIEMLEPVAMTREEYYAPFPLTREAYRRLPPNRRDGLLFCPAMETAKRLDPYDPKDV